jgi:hypothetical protein
MQGLYAAASNGASALLLSRNLDVVQLFCLLGVTISLAVILHLDLDGLNWVLAHVE